MKYNVWAQIEIADEENDSHVDLEDEQIMLASFKTLEDAKEYIMNAGIFTYSQDDKLFNCHELYKRHNESIERKKK